MVDNFVIMEAFMKKVISAWLLIGSVFLFSNCVLFSGFSVLAAAGKINKATISEKNVQFQEESGINLVITMRALWSMQDSTRNKAVKNYFDKLLDNQITYHFDENQEITAQQTINDEMVNITVNGIFQNYSDLEKGVLLSALTGALALINDTAYDERKIVVMFFKFFEEYNLPEIEKSAWFTDKNVRVQKNGLALYLVQ